MSSHQTSGWLADAGTVDSAPCDGLLQEAKVWAVSERKIGTLSQCVGIGRFFDREPIEKIIIPQHGLRKIFADPVFRASEVKPDLIISCGYRPEKIVRKMKRVFAGHTLSVHLQRPEIDVYDLVFVSRHDWTDELSQRAGYHQMTGVPHRLERSVLEHRRPQARSRFSQDDSKVVSVFLGGSNGAYDYDAGALDQIADAIKTVEAQGCRVLVSTSRRSSAETLEFLMKLENSRIHIWNGKAENPYLDFIAAADAFLVAKDSITMPCEALSTGKPVYILDLSHIPGHRLEKFERFHGDLRSTLRLTRDFSGDVEAYEYVPLNEAERLARIIAQRLPRSEA